MIKKIFILVLFVFISACGSDGDSTVPIAPAGIYTGAITPEGGSVGAAILIMNSNSEVAIVNTDSLEALIGTRSGNSLSGTIYSATAVSSTAQITSVSGNNIGGAYTSALGGGSFALVADPDLYNRSSSLSKLAGTWVDTVFTTAVGAGDSTWVIQSDGTFAATTTEFCDATGSLSVFNASKNEYSLTMDISNCPGLNGAYTGFAFVSDVSGGTDNVLSLIFSNGVVAGYSSPIK